MVGDSRRQPSPLGEIGKIVNIEEHIFGNAIVGNGTLPQAKKTFLELATSTSGNSVRQ